MYSGTLIRDLSELVERQAAKRENRVGCTWTDEEGYECGAAAVVLLLPDGDEARCQRHIQKGAQS